MKKRAFLSILSLTLMFSCTNAITPVKINDQVNQNSQINNSLSQSVLVYTAKTDSGFGLYIKEGSQEKIILDDADYKYNPVISNSGKSIAFFYNDNKTSKSGLSYIQKNGEFNIKHSDIAGSLNSKIKWSPNDHKIMVTNGKLNLYSNSVINTYDENNLSLIYNAEWVLNGEKIIYIKQNNIATSDHNSQLCIINSDGTDKKVIGTYQGEINSLNYSDRENRLVFNNKNNLYVTNIDNLKTNQITFSQESNKEKKYLSPVLSYNGKKILYLNLDLSTGDTSIGIIDSTGSNDKILTDPVDKAYNPKWSFDDKYIYYIGGKDPETDVSTNTQTHYKKIFSMNINGKEKTEITEVINDISGFDIARG